MPISIAESLYDELAVNRLIQTNGKVSLLGSCRELDDKVKEALVDFIDDRELISKSVPAPILQGVQYLYEQEWYPEQIDNRMFKP